MALSVPQHRGSGIPYEVTSNYNHETIVKPSSRSDEIFLIAKRFLSNTQTDGRSRSTLLKRALKLPNDVRADLNRRWGDLDKRRFENTNAWQEEWNAARDQFERAFASAAEDGMAESWRGVANAGLELRDTIRAGIQDELDLPRYYLALVLFTDTIEKAPFQVAGTLPGVLSPREQDGLISRHRKARSAGRGRTGRASSQDRARI